jgi:superfamily I DNA/RNA helicase
MIPIARWAPSDGLVLEPNALDAAKETARNLALTAGPGAGKTEMLAQRADFLLRTATCRYPRRILAISFKIDAAQNLRARVRRRCGADLGARLDSYTFHAFAKRLIDQFRPVLKGANALDPDYSIGQRRVQRTSITFADMVPLAQTIIENSRIARNAVRQTYSHVFLDEFQDCTADQYALITACFGGSTCLLTAVGDTKQSIMGWRARRHFPDVRGRLHCTPAQSLPEFPFRTHPAANAECNGAGDGPARRLGRCRHRRERRVDRHPQFRGRRRRGRRHRGPGSAAR